MLFQKILFLILVSAYAIYTGLKEVFHISKYKKQRNAGEYHLWRKIETLIVIIFSFLPILPNTFLNLLFKAWCWILYLPLYEGAFTLMEGNALWKKDPDLYKIKIFGKEYSYKPYGRWFFAALFIISLIFILILL